MTSPSADTPGARAGAGSGNSALDLACVTLAFLLASQSLGPLTPAAGRVLLLLVLAPLGWQVARTCVRGGAVFASCLGFLLPWLPLLAELPASDDGEIARVSGVCLSLGLWSWCSGASTARRRWHLTLAVTLSASIWLISQYSTLAVSSLEAAVHGLSVVAGWLAGERLRVGPSLAGFWCALPFLLLAVLCLVAPGDRRRRRQGWRLLVAVPATLAVFIALQPWLEHLLADLFRSLLRTPEPHRPWRVSPAQLIPLAQLLPWFVFVLLGRRLPAFSTAAQADEEGLWHRGWQPWAAMAALIAAALLALWPVSATLPSSASAGAGSPGTGSPGRGPVVAFHDRGHLDLTSPVVGRYGLIQVGMFGAVRTYLEASGYSTRTLEGDLTAEALSGIQVLTVINPQQEYSEAELQAVWDWVDEGGGLFVLGDHTDIFGIMGPLNQLLTPVDVRFEFDSAFALQRHWRHCLDFRPHPISRGMSGYHDAQIGTGASLTLVAPTLRPVVVGRYGFGDFGNRANDGRGALLGDYRYQLGERLGDVVLVAAGRVGQGAVAVFGDTTSLQPLSLPDAWPFVERTVRFLASPAPPTWPRQLAALVLVVVALGLWRRFAPLRLALLPGLYSLLVAALLLSWLPADPPRLPAADRLAWIQRGLVDRVPREFFEEGTMGGLAPMLMRAGYLPLTLDSANPEPLDAATLVLHVAPARAPSQAYVEAVERLLQRGGTLIVAAGATGRPAANRLLEACDLRIGDYPLGPLEIPLPSGDAPLPSDGQDGVATPTLRLLDAWPIHVGTRVEHEVHAAFEGDALIVEARPGAGRCLVIGDRRFFEDANFEGEFEFQRTNVELLDRLLDVGNSVFAQPLPSPQPTVDDADPAPEAP